MNLDPLALLVKAHLLGTHCTIIYITNATSNNTVLIFDPHHLDTILLLPIESYQSSVLIQQV